MFELGFRGKRGRDSAAAGQGWRRLAWPAGTAALILLLAVARSGWGRGSGDHATGPAAVAPETTPVPMHILVDQFGYRPGDPKVAVLRDPQEGYDHDDHYQPSLLLEVRRLDGDEVVLKAPVDPWNDGKTQASSGDRGWWADFSKLREPGRYTLYDPVAKRRSAPFSISEHPYHEVLKAALRTYYYQRSGIAKKPPQAEACWADEAAYLGKDQDLAARDITDPDNEAKARDVSGGWFDAGDTNKYVTFAAPAVHQLLSAWQRTPAAFGDDFNIPESGNGIPDVLDEVDWELAWLKKMQFDDGSAALKVGVIAFGNTAPPSSDRSRRYYIPPCTSATIAVAGMFAHAAVAYAGLPALAAERKALRERAESAWRNFNAAPSLQLHCDSGKIFAGNADWDEFTQTEYAVAAAAWLFLATGDGRYEGYLRAHYRDTRPYRDMGWSRYDAPVGEALLAYAAGTAGDARLKAAILADKRNDALADNGVYRFDPAADLYRAYLHDPQYHWGSNQPRANTAASNLDVVALALDPARNASYTQRALEMLHYFHGVNPFAKVYLTNMRGYGATSSLNSIFHVWFRHGTKWSDVRDSECGPAPGYVPGGPNAGGGGVLASLRPPVGQPAQKSYRDWNGDGPEASWTVTEPAIYFQAAYIRLLAPFAE